MPALHRNPILFREWRIATRPGKLWGTLIVVFGLLLLAFVYITLQEKYSRLGFFQQTARPEIRWPVVFERFAIAVMVVQSLIAFYVCFGLALDCLVKERQSNTHEFLVTLPISAPAKVVGLCVGVNLLPLLLWALLTPVGLIFGVYGGLDLHNLIWLYGLMLAGMAAVSLMGVAIGSGLGKRRGAWLLVLLLLLLGGPVSEVVTDSESIAMPVITVAPFGILAASVSDPAAISDVFESGAYHFYTLTVPWQVCPLAFYLFLAIVSFFAAVRKLSRPSAPPLPRWATAIAFAAFQALLIGFFADSLSSVWVNGHLYVASLYLAAFFVLILVWGWFSAAGYAGLMQWVERKRNWPGRLFTEAFTDIRTPLFVSGAVLWGITVGAVLCINAFYWQTLPAGMILLGGVIMLGFLLAYQAVCLLGCLVSRRAGGPIGVMFLALVAGIPAAFSSIEGLEHFAKATSFGLLYEHDLLKSWYAGVRLSVSDPVIQSILWAAGLLAVFFALCAWRFQALLQISPLGRKMASPAAG